MQSALDAIGKCYGSFQITQYLPIDSLRCTLIELVHVASGARVMHIAADDPENLFCLSFQTLPSNSNGVAHILEHTVLCGSQKFPVKDPFFAMMRRSLNTFMNAFTGQDFTCYAASSQIEKDFYNLLEVYVDAVFHPQLKKTSFLQEGHRLEFVNPNDLGSPLQFQGIVFNEMKGAMMSSESRLWQAVAQRLFPDLPYAYNSGGDPKEIPSLSYEELVEFHGAFYHPSRCLFYFYGNIPLAKHLDFLEAHALSGVKKLAPLPPLPLQPRLRNPVTAHVPYPIAPVDDPKGKAEIAFSWLTAPLVNTQEVLALNLLDSLLMETDASPLKKALLESGLCREAESSLDLEISEIPFTVTCKGTDPEHLEPLRALVLRTLGEVVKNPPHKEDVEASLHQMEFERREIGGDGGPFGLALFFRAGLIQQHGARPEQALQIGSLFNELRTRLRDRSYLPKLIRKHFLENRHTVAIAMIPDPTLEEREASEERKRLEAIQTRLTSEQKKELQHQTEQLLHYQEEVENQSLECLPKLTLRDVPEEPRDFALTHDSFECLDLFHHDCFTNGILYADLLFDLPHIPREDLPLLALLAKIWTELGAGRCGYEKTLQREQAYTGGIDAHLALHVSALDADVLKPAFSLRGKALERNARPFFELLRDFAEGPNTAEPERISGWLRQHATELEESVSANPLSYAIQLSLMSYSRASVIYNLWNGAPYHQFIKELLAERPSSWIHRLHGLAQKILAGGKPHLILGCDRAARDLLAKKNFYTLGERPVQYSAPKWRGDYPLPSIPSQVRLISSPVAFTALGMRAGGYTDPDAAAFIVLSELLGNVFLHPELREKGGAYGCGASYAPTTGNFHFYSLRDPHLARSLTIFRSSLEKVVAGAFNDRQIEEAKLGIIAAMDNPVPPGGRAIVAYSWFRSERLLADRQKLRRAVLALDATALRQAARRLLDLPSTSVSLLGKQLWEKEEKKLSSPLVLSTGLSCQADLQFSQ